MRIKSITHKGRADVYNLEVPGLHCFIVNGGVVIHNCMDAIRYACYTHRHQIRQKADVKPDYTSRDYINTVVQNAYAGKVRDLMKPRSRSFDPMGL